jgi:hypothetical protein
MVGFRQAGAFYELGRNHLVNDRCNLPYFGGCASARLAASAKFVAEPAVFIQRCGGGSHSGVRTNIDAQPLGNRPARRTNKQTTTTNSELK